MSQTVQARQEEQASPPGGATFHPDERYQHLVDALRQRDRKIEHLEIALRTNRTIGVAIGVVMATLKCTRDEAFSAIAVCSNKINRKVVAVADYVEQTGTLPGSPGLVDVQPVRRKD